MTCPVTVEMLSTRAATGREDLRLEEPEEALRDGEGLALVDRVPALLLHDGGQVLGRQTQLARDVHQLDVAGQVSPRHDGVRQ